ncbi:MAG: CHAT domain-containing protein [Cyanobacteria bacterium SBLK]|nr:CHAT domain-containing protein [Cyanobacteria bacterium SBLK]
MMWQKVWYWGCLGLGSVAITALPVFSQSIIPAHDGTGTIVIFDDNTYQISGGTIGGENLFHSFSELGLNTGEIGNFWVDANIENILARVVGGSPSVFDGMLQINGGEANLYLMNPAGILFGENARLNVSGDFFATTATAIGFGGDRWFEALGNNNYANLTGTPLLFAFDRKTTAEIANAGRLEVPEGQRLMLLGGSIVSTGELIAPGGNILVASIPETHLIRLSQPGGLLSLEIEPPRDAKGTILPLSPLDLPALLTGESAEPIAPGTTQISGTVSVSSSELNAFELGEVAPPEINIFGDRVALLDADIDVSGSGGGGNVRIGGDRRGEGNFPRARRTFIDENTSIRADALGRGEGGNIIIWSDELTAFAGKARARGGEAGGDGGFVEVSGKSSLIYEGEADLRSDRGEKGTLLLDPEDILIRGGLGTGTNTVTLPDVFQSEAGSPFILYEDNLELLGANADVILEASNNIIIESLSDGILAFAGTGAIAFRADTDGDGSGAFSMDGGDTIFTSGRSLEISGANVTTGAIQTVSGVVGNPGGSVTISATNGNVTAGEILTGSEAADGGTVSISATHGNIEIAGVTSGVDPGTGNGTGGDITLSATGNIEIGDSLISGAIDRSNIGGRGTGGNIFLNAGGAIDVGMSVFSAVAGSGNAGEVLLSAGGDIAIAQGIFAFSTGGNGNSVTLRGEDISLGAISSSSIAGGAGGNIDITASGTFRALASIFIDTTGDDSFIRFQDGSIQSLGSVATRSETGASLIAAGITGNGSIIIRHGGGIFTVGDSVTNGTLGAIDGGDLSLSPNRAFDADFSSEGISILTQTSDSLSSSQIRPLSALSLNRSGDRGNSKTLELASLAEAKAKLADIEALTGVKSAIVYASFLPRSLAGRSDFTSREAQTSQAFRALLAPGTTLNAPPIAFAPQDSDVLELLLISADGKPKRWRIEGATREIVREVALEFRRTVTNVRRPSAYLKSAGQLYRWLIAPLEAELEARGIENLAFIADEGLRSLPLAALHDGKQFLIERYSVGLLPSFTLTQIEYTPLANLSVLAMGRSQFADLEPLPAVPTELETIAGRLWPGKSFLNEAFTFENLKNTRANAPYAIVHLATHGEFRPGKPGNSYIQLWDDRLPLDRLQTLQFRDPPVELLVLSACRTALGDKDAELGFAGLAVAAGVKSALGSLWYVSDVGTLALMTSFYEQLKQTPVKAEAIRRAQLSLLRGETYLEKRTLQTGKEAIALPDELSVPRDRILSHPYYWSGFTLIGNPY